MLEKLLLYLSRPLAFTLDNLFDLFTGGKDRPKYFQAQEVHPGLKYFDDHYAEIRKEFEKVYNNEDLLGYEQYDPNQNYIANTVDVNKKWKVFVFNLMGAKHEKNLERCPTIKKGLEGLDGYFQCMFSVLEPGKSIPPHCGRYRGYLRYHLGIIVPQNNPPYIKVGGEPYTWKEGESTVIDDSWEHEVINNSDEMRVVFIIDILRPLPRVIKDINYWVIHTLMKSTYAKKMEKNMKSLEK